VGGLQSAALTIGTVVATVLVVPSAWALLRVNLTIGLAATLPVAAALWVCWSNLRDSLRPRPPGGREVQTWQRWIVLGAFPAVLLGSVFDCAGFRGCTPICAFLNTRLVPGLITLTAIYLLIPSRVILFALTATSFALVVPSCHCYNPVNRAWIDVIGLSPVCFAAPFSVGLMITGSLLTGRRILMTGVVAWASSIGLLGFHIGHHYFHWPW